jgi:GH43 family beta-xylosidase
MTTTGGDHISITRSATIWGLLNGQTKTIWTDTNNTRNQQMWAPEMHRIDNTWYMFYSSGGVNTSNRCRVLRGCNGPNPYDCTYTYLAELTPPPGKQGGRMKDDPNAIDGTYLEVNGGRYSVVSANDEGGVQSIQITELDTNTWTVKGWNIISEPDQPWEKNATGADLDPNSPMAVNEGPHVSLLTLIHS